MSSASLRRALLVALASLALCAPAAVARPADLRSEAPTSSLSGTTGQPSAEAIPGPAFQRPFPLNPNPFSRREAALAQERSYSTYVEPAPQREAATIAAADPDDGITWVPFVLGLTAALAVGLVAGSGPPRHAAGDLNAGRSRHRGPASAGPPDTSLQIGSVAALSAR